MSHGTCPTRKWVHVYLMCGMTRCAVHRVLVCKNPCWAPPHTCWHTHSDISGHAMHTLAQVFAHQGAMYLLPEGSKSGALHLYKVGR